jgi:glycosyltransferase involved in cell wall biosynthesis
MNFTRKIKIGLVHDDFIQFGGAEKLFLDLILEFSKDENYETYVFSSLISEEWKKIFDENKIIYKESFLKKIPFCYKFSKIFFLFELYYLAFQNYDFEGFDLVVSSSTRYAHSIVTKPNTYHISYVNSLPKMFWEPEKYFAGKKFEYKILLNFFPYFQRLDYITQHSADIVITNSKNIRNKYKKNTLRKSLVLYPYTNVITNASRDKSDFYLLISRLVSWKRIDYVLDAFAELPEKKLKILGTGNMLKKYQRNSPPNVEFLGFVSEAEKIKLLSTAKGLIIPQDEDFGLVILESLMCRTSLIYFNKGGASEVLNSKVGESFDFQSKDFLKEAIDKNSENLYKIEDFEEVIGPYSKDNFLRFLRSLITKKFSKLSSNGKI